MTNAPEIAKTIYDQDVIAREKDKAILDLYDMQKDAAAKGEHEAKPYGELFGGLGLGSIGKISAKELADAAKKAEEALKKAGDDLTGKPALATGTVDGNSGATAMTGGKPDGGSGVGKTEVAAGAAAVGSGEKKATQDANGQYRDEKGQFTNDPNKVETDLTRPSLREKTKKEIKDNTDWTEDGKAIDLLTGKVIEPPYHYGHIYGSENRRLIDAATNLGMTQKQLNDYVNARPDKFKIENASENWSHKGE